MLASNPLLRFCLVITLSVLFHGCLFYGFQSPLENEGEKQKEIVNEIHHKRMGGELEEAISLAEKGMADPSLKEADKKDVLLQWFLCLGEIVVEEPEAIAEAYTLVQTYQNFSQTALQGLYMVKARQHETEADSLMFYLDKLAQLKGLARGTFQLFMEDLIYQKFSTAQFDEAWSLIQYTENLDKTLSYHKKDDAFLLYKSGVALELYHTEKAQEAAREIISRTSKNKGTIADAYHNLAYTYEQQLDYGSAELYYQEALRYGQEVLEQGELAVSYINLASVQAELRKHREAKANIRQAIGLLEEDSAEEFNPNLIEAWVILFQVYKEQNSEHDSCLIALKTAEQLRLKHLPSSSGLSIDLAFSDYYLGRDSEKALFYAKQAVGKTQNRLKSMNHADANRNLARVYLQQEKPKEATQAIRTMYEAILLEGYTMPAEIWRVPKAEMLSLQSTTIQYEFAALALEASLSIWKANHKQVPLSELIALSEFVVDLGEEIQRMPKHKASKEKFMSGKRSNNQELVLNFYVSLYLESKSQEDLIRCYRLAERGRAMSLLEAMQAREAGLVSNVPDSLLRQEQNLAYQADRLDKELSDAIGRKDSEKMQILRARLVSNSEETRNFKAMLEKDYPEYFARRFAPIQITPLDELKKRLEADMTLLAYTELPERHLVFALTKDSVRLEVLELEQDYLRKTNALITSLTDFKAIFAETVRNYNDYVGQAHHLYRSRVKPYLYEGTERLVIIPDGRLSYIPFECLLTSPQAEAEGVEEVNYENLPYLLHDLPLSYNYSITFWAEQYDKRGRVRTNNGQVLAYAPIYDEQDRQYTERLPKREQLLRQSLQALPGAKREVQTLEAKYPGRYVYERAAKEADFKAHAKNYQILHMAMHGIVDGGKPDFSALAFSDDGEKEDNFLCAYEVKRVPLNADLVILSACETGSGRYQKGEGVASLGRSFIEAGSPTVFMTLWVLNDHAGAALTEILYQTFQENLPKDHALQLAKQRYIKQADPIGQHPAFWSCMVMAGEPDRIKLGRGWPWTYYALSGAGLALLAAGGWWFYRQKQGQTA